MSPYCKTIVGGILFPKDFYFPGINPGHAKSGQKTNPKFMKSGSHKVNGVRHLPAESERTVLNGHIHQMRELPPGSIVEGVVFRVEEHLQMQEQTERRAHELWHAGGCRDGAALSDWLQAEREVLEEFIRAYFRERSSLPQPSRPGPSVGVARRKAEARILKR